MGPDSPLFHFINGWPDGLEPFFLTVSEGNKWWPVRIALLAMVIWMLWRRPTRWAVICAMIAWPIANEMTDILKNGLQDLRPTVALEPGTFNLRVPMMTSFGTASAHSANMMAVATALWFWIRKEPTEKFPWIPIWFGIAILVGISRIYVGVHWPRQVLFGWGVGAATALTVCWAVWSLGGRRVWSPPAEVPSSEAPTSDSPPVEDR